MTDKIIQLPLPLNWHQQPQSTWKIRHHISSVNRPTEDEALDNIYYAHRAHHGRYAHDLNGLERKVYYYELWSFQNHPKWYTEADRVKWIASKTGMTISSIKDTLHGVKLTLRELVRVEDIAVAEQIKQAAREALFELAAEYEVKKYRIAA